MKELTLCAHASGHLLRMMTFKDFLREGVGMCVPDDFI